MKNKTNNVTSHIGKKLLVLGIITVYLCMATACGTNKNNNNSGSMAASPSPSTSPAAQGSTEAQTTEDVYKRQTRYYTHALLPEYAYEDP